MTVLHDFNKFWEMMRREKGSQRPPLTEAQRKAKPPVSQPVFLTHPTHRPQGAVRQSRLRGAHQRAAGTESDEMLAFLFAHQMQAEYRYAHRWQAGDVLMWEDIGDHPPRRRRLRAGRAPADQALPGDGHPVQPPALGNPSSSVIPA